MSGRRQQQPCVCPHGTQTFSDLGPMRVRLSTTPGCLEHDACHRWTPEAVAARQAAMKHALHPWCPIHEAKGCPA